MRLIKKGHLCGMTGISVRSIDLMSCSFANGSLKIILWDTNILSSPSYSARAHGRSVLALIICP